MLDMVTANPDYREWSRENSKNPEFVAYYKANRDVDLHDIWRQKLEQEARKDLHQIPIEDALDALRDNIRGSVLSGWFRSGDSDYKPELVDSVLTNKGVLNAAMNVAYHNYLQDFGHYNVVTNKFQLNDESRQPLSFNKWLTTPQEMYRGTTGQKTIASDIFSSYTPDKLVAARFTKDNTGQASVKKDLSDVDLSRISTIKVRPIDTYGSYQTTGELEYLIPSRWFKKKGAKK